MLRFAPEAIEHLDAIEVKHHSAIQGAIDEQLAFTPDVPTRSRKPLEQPPFAATWELRCGAANHFRIFYDVDREAAVMWVLAIGVKDRNRLIIGGEEFHDEDRSPGGR